MRRLERDSTPRTPLPDPLERPTVSVEEAGRACGLGRAKAYAEAARYEATGGIEGLPVLRFGRLLRVPTAELRRLLGIDSDLSPPPATTARLSPGRALPNVLSTSLTHAPVEPEKGRRCG
jgi:hypothetical protein